MKGLKTVFLITDTQIKEEGFLEDVDSVLNTGEVPNLFAADEKQEVMEVFPYIIFLIYYNYLLELFLKKILRLEFKILPRMATTKTAV